MEDKETAQLEVSGEDALNGALAFLRRFTALPSPETYVMLALWAAHTHAIEAFNTTPRVLFRSEKRASGKSKTMWMVSLLSANSRVYGRINEATLFQAIDLYHPSLFIEEVDTIFRTNNSQPGMLSVLDQGFERGVPVPRTDGKGAIKEYETFGPVAMASLRPLPDALASRTITVWMTPGTPADEFDRMAHLELAHQYRDALGAWAASEDVLRAVHKARPVMPKGVVDRDRDIWRPLLALADEAGGQWPALARQACRHFVFGEAVTTVLTPEQMLLRDIRTVWKGTRMFTDALTDALRTMEPWASTWTEGTAAKELAALLKPAGIEPKVLRIGEDLKRGYYRSALEAAWDQAGMVEAA